MKDTQASTHHDIRFHCEKITHKRMVAPGIYLLSYTKRRDFIPGQVVGIGIDTEHSPRLYSICSGIMDREIHLLFNVKDDGFLTPHLALMKPGDEILVSEPYGSFSCHEGPGYWIASGTGIAPFYSMLKSGFAKDKILIHGGRYRYNFYFEDEFADELKDRYIRCSTRETAPDLYHGRLTNYLKEQKQLPLDYKYYLCGNAQMVVDVRDILIDVGVPYENIISEIYF